MHMGQLCFEKAHRTYDQFTLDRQMILHGAVVQVQTYYAMDTVDNIQTDINA